MLQRWPLQSGTGSLALEGLGARKATQWRSRSDRAGVGHGRPWLRRPRAKAGAHSRRRKKCVLGDRHNTTTLQPGVCWFRGCLQAWRTGRTMPPRHAASACLVRSQEAPHLQPRGLARMHTGCVCLEQRRPPLRHVRLLLLNARQCPTVTRAVGRRVGAHS
jgi:hypothetical protein